MKQKNIKIGKFTTENNVFFAPLAGFSDFAMRSICISYGAGLTFTEMVSCKGLLFDNENTKSLLRSSPDEKIKCVQIFGNDPEIMRRALESEQLAPFDVADINFGCPMPKIFNNGEGSALMEKPALAEKIVSECKKSGKAITCKIRTGIKDSDPLAVDFAKAIEQGGADMITVHGRSRAYLRRRSEFRRNKQSKTIGVRSRYRQRRNFHPCRRRRTFRQNGRGRRYDCERRS